MKNATATLRSHPLSLKRALTFKRWGGSSWPFNLNVPSFDLERISCATLDSHDRNRNYTTHTSSFFVATSRHAISPTHWLCIFHFGKFLLGYLHFFFSKLDVCIHSLAHIDDKFKLGIHSGSTGHIIHGGELYISLASHRQIGTKC